jgi:dipeptidyl aminopeptidase/acylaminoacyl peptidase
MRRLDADKAPRNRRKRAPRPRRSSAALAAALFLSCAAHAAPPPLESFFRLPEFENVALSPGGRYLAAITRLRQMPEGRNIVVFDVDIASARTITGYETHDVDWFVWASDDRIVFKLDRDMDAVGSQNRYLGIFAVDRSGERGMRLDDPQESLRRRRGAPEMPGSGMREKVEPVPGAPPPRERMLLTKRNLDAPLPDVYALDVRKGGLTHISANERDIRKWIADNAGEVRAAIGPASGRSALRQVLWYREDAESEWKQALEFDVRDLDVLGFQKGNRELLVASRIGRERFALFALDPRTGDFGKPLLEDPVYDVYHRASSYAGRAADGRLLYYQYMADKPRIVYFDDTWRGHQTLIDAALRDTVNMIVGWSDDEKRFLVYSWSDRLPGRYYLYEPEERRLEELLSPRSWIDPAQMRPMDPIAVRARDGVMLHGYLTLPARADGAKQPPLVVYPHGGPYGVRDVWGFDPAVQFLASRGYAVLQVNFRGSGGYGRTFEQSGYQRMGLQMQDDITDAVEWVVGKGFADPARVCIYGAGYGGYAALMGLIRTPKLYRCGIDYGGPVDLTLLYRSNVSAGRWGSDDAARRWWTMTLGDPIEDAKRLRETSPVFHVDRIRAPLLVIHGQPDDRVSIEHYRRLTEALEEAGRTYETLVKERSGTGLHAQADQVELWTRVEQFLAKEMQ